MNTEKERICHSVAEREDELFQMACDIFDHPELGFQEFYASGLLEDYIEKHGFSVERGAGGLETAFRAEWERGSDGPTIGFMMEYDALVEVDHACGHHLQGPVCIGAAIALRDAWPGPLKIVLYGTPSEESGGGKIVMARNGCFRDVDVMLCYHAGLVSGVSYANKALLPTRVTFHGKAAHASASPELGRSALDAMMLAFHGLEIMREHVKDQCRISYTVLEGTGAANIVHETAKAHITLRSPDKDYLMQMEKRMHGVIQGACLMTEVTADIEPRDMFWNLVSVPSINETVIRLADELGAKKVSHYRSTGGGSSDVGNVSWLVPVANIYTYFCDGRAHSREWTNEGKTEKARDALASGARLLGLSALEFASDRVLLEKIKMEHKKAVEEAS